MQLLEAFPCRCIQDDTIGIELVSYLVSTFGRKHGCDYHAYRPVQSTSARIIYYEQALVLLD